MEEYKKYVDHQHAPESLIADTIKKVKAEEARKAQTQEAAKVTRMPQAAEVQKKKGFAALCEALLCRSGRVSPCPRWPRASGSSSPWC